MGAYSFDSTLIANVPKFIAASYYVSGGADHKENPHDALCLAKSADINAMRLPGPGHRRLPPTVYQWGNHMESLMRSYAKELGRMDEANLEEVSTSDLGASEEFPQCPAQCRLASPIRRATHQNSGRRGDRSLEGFAQG